MRVFVVELGSKLYKYFGTEIFMKLFFLVLIALSFQFVRANTLVEVETNMGTIEVELFDDQAPISVKNFLSYLDLGFYTGTLVHRVVPGFVILGGGLDQNMNEKKTNDPIANEAGNGVSNLKGTLGMACTDEINSATSQFYINTKDNQKLDHVDNTPQKFGYAVFGKVNRGYEVVDAIEKVATHSVGEYDNVPIEPVVILSIRRADARSSLVCQALVARVQL